MSSVNVQYNCPISIIQLLWTLILDNYTGHWHLTVMLKNWHCTLILDIDFGYWYWTLTLDSYTRNWHWTLILDIDTRYWNWTLVLDINSGHWYWTLILVSLCEGGEKVLLHFIQETPGDVVPLEDHQSSGHQCQCAGWCETSGETHTVSNVM